jgi:hypothetical protein
MTDDDVFYNNNLNAFVIDAKTVDASLKAQEFQLECIWAQPVKGGGHSGLHRRVVPFHELILDPKSQQAYHFDYEAAKRQLKETVEAEKQRKRPAAPQLTRCPRRVRLFSPLRQAASGGAAVLRGGC